MRKSLPSKILSIVLSLAVAASTVAVNPMTVSAEEKEKPEWLTTRESDSDIIVSTTNNSVWTLNNLSDALKAGVADASQSEETTDIKTAGINVTDLSSWFVYDHYDELAYVGGAEEYYERTGNDEVLRPYFPYTDSYANSWPASGSVDFKDSENWTIENAKVLNPTIPAPSISLEFLPSGAWHLKEHIAAGIADGKANIYWYGYSRGYGTDWAFYPTDSGGKKMVDYEVDASKVYFHTVQPESGMGFLFNTKLDEGKLSGYAVMTNFTYTDKDQGFPTGIAGFSIYKINNVNAASFHDGRMIYDAAGSYTMPGVTRLTTKDLTAEECTRAKGYSQTEVHMEIKDDYIYMTIKPIGNGSDPDKTVTVFDQKLSTISGYTSYDTGGFGPIVSYTGYGHTCRYTSTIDYTNLRMSISNEDGVETSILKGLERADFTNKTSGDSDTKKYFVLIGDKDKDFFSINSDYAFLAMLKEKNIILVTNVDTVVTGSGSEQGTNYKLEDYLGEGNIIKINDITNESTENEIATKVLEAIDSANYNDSSANSSADPMTYDDATATSVCVVKDGWQVGSINTARSSFEDKVDLDVKITEIGLKENIKVKVIGPNGVEVKDTPTSSNSVTYDDESKVISVPNDAMPGKYTIKVSINNNNGVPSMTTFDVVNGIDVYFNGGTEPDCTEIYGCKTTNPLGEGAARGNYAYSFVVENVYPEVDLVYEISVGNNLTTKLVENKDYIVAVSADRKKYTLTISTAAMQTINDKIQIDAHSKNVFDEIEGTELYTTPTGNTVAAICIKDVDFKAYLRITNPAYINEFEEELSVWADDTKLKKEVDYRYDPETGEIKVFGNRIGSKLYVRGELKVGNNIVNKLNEEVDMGLKIVKALGGEEAKNYVQGVTTYLYIESENPDYDKLPSDRLEVYYGNRLLSSYAEEYSYDEEKGLVSVWAAVLTDERKLLVFKAKRSIFSVYTTDSSNVIFDEDTLGDEKAFLGQAYSTSVVAEKDYKLPKEIVIKMGEQVISGYTYDSETGDIYIPGEKVTGDITITVKADPNRQEAPPLEYFTALAKTAVDKSDAAILIDELSNYQNMEYSLDDGKSYIPVGNTLVSGLSQRSVKFRYKENERQSASPDTEVVIPKVKGPDMPELKPSCEVTVGKEEAMLIGLTTDMEYSTIDTLRWTDVTDPSVKFGEGFVNVRIKETDERMASDIETVEVLAKRRTGHNYTPPVFVFASDGKSAVAEFTCLNDETHVETVEADVTSEVKVPAGCSDGQTSYTAKVNFLGEEYTETIDLWDLAAGGHLYKYEEFIFEEDGKSGTARFICDRNTEHILEVPITTTKTEFGMITSEIRNHPTCENMGVTTYTARITYQGKVYMASKIITDIPATGHSYKDADFTFSGDKKSASVRLTCANNPNHIIDLNADVKASIKQAATCEKNGITTYTATVTYLGRTFSATKDAEDVVPHGHSYDKVKFDFSADCRTATATITCSHDPKHSVKLAATVTSKVTKAATCKDKGTTTYTARATYEGQVYEGKKNLNNIPKVSHKWNKGKVTKKPTYVSKGVMTYTCKVCKKKKTKSIPKLDIENAALPIFMVEGSRKNNTVELNWKVDANADGYDVYWAYCGKDYKFLTDTKLLKYTHKNLDSKKAYKYHVFSYRIVNGEKKYLRRSMTVHVAMKNYKETNAAFVEASKNIYNLKVKEKAAIYAYIIKADAGKKDLQHAELFRYYTTNNKIATVDKNGVIKAKNKGTCTIYVVANNGAYSPIKVTVK